MLLLVLLLRPVLRSGCPLAQVHARWKGQELWYAGVLTKVSNSGQCAAIRYDDGEKEPRYVLRSLLLSCCAELR